MPLYDYRCNDCGAEFEAVHSMFDNPRLPCPDCGLLHTRRLITTFPHTRMAWKAWDRNDTGSDKMVIRSARRGLTQPKDGWAAKEWLDERKRARE